MPNLNWKAVFYYFWRTWLGAGLGTLVWTVLLFIGTSLVVNGALNIAAIAGLFTNPGTLMGMWLNFNAFIFGAFYAIASSQGQGTSGTAVTYAMLLGAWGAVSTILAMILGPQLAGTIMLVLMLIMMFGMQGRSGGLSFLFGQSNNFAMGTVVAAAAVAAVLGAGALGAALAGLKIVLIYVQWIIIAMGSYLVVKHTT